MRNDSGRWVTAANLVTAFRLLLFSFFIFWAHLEQVWLGALAFALAWGLDAVDGWLARRLRQATAFGFVFDKAVDRLVLVGGLFVLMVYGLVPLWSLLLLTKEALIIPVVVRRGVAGQALRDLGAAGKIVAALQGFTLLWLLVGVPWGELPTAAVAVLGGWTGWRYVRGVQ